MFFGEMLSEQVRLAIYVFLGLVVLMFYAKPKQMFDEDGKLKSFGYSTMMILAVVSYFMVTYYSSLLITE